MTTRFKGLMKWQEDPTWYDWQWVLTNEAPESARHNFELYMEELYNYHKEKLTQGSSD